MALDPARFIDDNTRVRSAPLTPELRFHLADEALPVWEMTEEALGRIGLPPPFWAFAWAGGQALARYLLDNPEVVGGKRALDFACGCAIAGIAAARAGAARVEASEIDPFAVAAARANAALNNVTIAAEETDLVGADRGWDVVLAGDVFYEAPAGGRIADWLAGLHARGATVLIGDPGRAFLPKDRLEPLARYDAPAGRDLEDRDVRLARVWRFRG
ncbi:nicotinamide N-methylase [Marinicauda salina]|uniref:Nicotinamide N-methylase n=1 Tax=Marinicauda salina TaxID=2135793 RepID=A0A2U2BUG2_9PROT|nr:50S ribosomal protein L11 methyltransferase [Marinicauda salina]PWE17671.1 nicotinamide N-methylase [Marinicauda salina]